MVQEPDFSGEKMKMPTERTGSMISQGEPKTVSTLILLLVLALVAIMGGIGYWYYLGQQAETAPAIVTRPPLESNKEPETPTATAQTDSLNTMSTSDEISTIEADIESTNLDSLDSELVQIETELNAALEE